MRREQSCGYPGGLVGRLICGCLVHYVDAAFGSGAGDGSLPPPAPRARVFVKSGWGACTDRSRCWRSPVMGRADGDVFEVNEVPQRLVGPVGERLNFSRPKPASCS